MLEEQLRQISIEKPDSNIYREIRDRWDHVAKPIDSMGKFEPLVCRIGAILGDADVDIKKKAVIVMCADNGVIAEGVSQSGCEVTQSVAAQMGKRRSSVCKMAAEAGADVIPVDIGMCAEQTPEGVLPRKVVRGTKNFAVEPAMTMEQTLEAIETGIKIVETCKKDGYRLLATGEMGIGNTTTGSAVAAALLGRDADFVTGRGAGLDDAGLSRKKQVIGQALVKYEFCRPEQDQTEKTQADPEETLRILSCVGGADIAGLAGVFVGGAICHIPVVVDGLISASAALAAERLAPGTRDYMVPSHQSREPAAKMLLDELQLQPVIDAQLSLGEGTGAVMMFALLDLAMSVYADPTTFSDIRVEQYTRFTD